MFCLQVLGSVTEQVSAETTELKDALLLSLPSALMNVLQSMSS